MPLLRLENSLSPLIPDDPNAWYNKGVALYLLGKFDESIIAFDQALALNPAAGKVWTKKGDALQKLGRYTTGAQSL